MITPTEITQKAERVYPRAISAFFERDEAFFPYRMPCDLSLPDSHSELIRQVEQLRGESREVIGFGYSIMWEEKAKRQFGRNRYPVAIIIESLDDLLKLVRKAVEFRTLRRCEARVLAKFPKLAGWIANNWRRLLQVEMCLDELLSVVQFMLQHPRPNCFTRELPLTISSKLIERNQSLLREWFDLVLPPETIDFGSTRSFEQRYGFRYARQHLLVRFLDPALARELQCPWLELSLPIDEVSALIGDSFPAATAEVFIVENKVNLLTLPATPRGIALGGLGCGVTALWEIPWLSRQPLYYWGDLDLDGFEILALIRHRFPHTQSLFMDVATLALHRSLATNVVNRPSNEPTELTESELAAYRLCKLENLRFEQEHIPHLQVKQRMAALRQAF